MTRQQRVTIEKYKKKDKAKKLGRWSGKRKGRSSKKDKAKNKSDREWDY